MARNLSADAIAKITQQYGAEPLIIVGVEWTIGGGEVMYGTEDITAIDPSSGVEQFIEGKIVEIGNLDSIVAISLNESSEEIDLKFDDTDGIIKEIINLNDIHLRDVCVYQWFRGIPLDDKFLIFRGKINSPISWNEGDQTVSFSVLSQLEDNEVGFSPEEGEFPDIPDELIGKLWPECFGTAVTQEALQVDHKIQGSLGESVGIASFTIPSHQGALQDVIQYLLSLQVLWAFASGYLKFIGAEQASKTAQQNSDSAAQAQAPLKQQIADLGAELEAQEAKEKDSFRVIGGENFPRGGLTLDINGALFSGSFSGDIFNVSEAVHPERKNYPGVAVGGCLVAFLFQSTFTPSSQAGFKSFFCAEHFPVTQVDGTSFNIYTGNILGDEAGEFLAQPGGAVKIASAEPIRYVVSITPGCGGVNNTGVLKVQAFGTLASGQRVLFDVPTNKYTAFRQSYGTITATIVQINDALSKDDINSLEDTIYVTYQSKIGPNPVDIMEYLIGRYTSFPVNPTTFASVRARLVNYPMNFCLKQQKNILTVLKELAFMSRTAIFLKNGVFFLKYLPEAPTSIHTFDESNTDLNSLALEFTETEDLITKFIGTWRVSDAQEEDHKAILRYNVAKYGTHEETFNFYAYNLKDLVLKVMTFWIIRRGNTWKKLRFKASLDALNVETFDGVTLNFIRDYASNSAVLGTVEESGFDPNENTMEFSVWTGVRSGEMEPYDFAYPADVSQFLKFPTAVETAAGFAGGNGPGKDAAGVIGQRGKPSGGSVTYNGQVNPFNMGENRLNTDKGDDTPSDQGDNNPGKPNVQGTGTAGAPTEATQTASRTSHAQPNFLSTFFIDIRNTEVIDTDTNQKSIFATFFREIDENQELLGSTNAKWKDAQEEAKTGEFDFKFDEEDNHFGAGTAFLEDNPGGS